MAAAATQVLLFFVFVLLTAHLGTCLQCYQCSSGPDDICDDTFSYHARQSVPVINCESSPSLPILGAGLNTHCGKMKRKTLDPRAPNDYVFRGCVPENYCKLVKNDVKECQVCDDMLCNSSSVTIPSYIIVAIFSFLVARLNF